MTPLPPCDHEGCPVTRCLKKRLPIRARLFKAFGERHSMNRHALMMAVFPPDDYPRAWRYATGGGPPGCVLAFEAALKRYGFWYRLNGEIMKPARGDEE